MKDTKTFFRRFFTTVAILLLAACGSDVQVTTEFNATHDVKEGDFVFYNQQIVGEVTKVNQHNGKTQLGIELSDKGVAEIKKKAAIVVNRLKANKPLEIYNFSDASQPIESGDQLQGLDSMFQLGAWMIGESLDAGSEGLLGYVTAFQKYLNGEKWQQDKQALRDGVSQLGKEAENMADALSQELTKATSDLEKVEKQTAEVVGQLGEELAPVMGELTKSGQAIVNELDKFSRNLEKQNAEGKELGTTVMQSLLEALQKVNESMDQAVVEQQQNKELSDQPTQSQTPEAVNVPKSEPQPEEK